MDLKDYNDGSERWWSHLLFFPSPDNILTTSKTKTLSPTSIPWLQASEVTWLQTDPRNAEIADAIVSGQVVNLENDDEDADTESTFSNDGKDDEDGWTTTPIAVAADTVGTCNGNYKVVVSIQLSKSTTYTSTNNIVFQADKPTGEGNSITALLRHPLQLFLIIIYNDHVKKPGENQSISMRV